RRKAEQQRLKLAEERAARAVAEKTQTQRAFLAEVMAALAESLDYRVNLARLAGLAVPRLADWCSIDVAASEEGRQSRQLAVAHVDAAKIELAHELRQKYPPDPEAPYGVSNVLRTGRPELYEEVSEELVLERSEDAEHLKML